METKELLGIPRFKPKSYDLKDDVISIYNFRQAAFYWLNGLAPLDIFPSRNQKTNEPTIIFVFRRSDTKNIGVHDAWMEHSKNGTIKFRYAIQKIENMEDTIKIVNFKQAAFYYANDLEPVEIRPSIDNKDEPVIVFVFRRSETQSSGAYDAWCKNNQTLEC